jgi:hypothetical protein
VEDKSIAGAAPALPGVNFSPATGGVSDDKLAALLEWREKSLAHRVASQVGRRALLMFLRVCGLLPTCNQPLVAVPCHVAGGTGLAQGGRCRAGIAWVQKSPMSWASPCEPIHPVLVK